MTNKIEVTRELLEELLNGADSMGWRIAEVIRDLLAAPEAPRQEPVGRVSYIGNGFIRVRCAAPPALETPLYAAPLPPDHSGGGAGMSDLMKIAADLACRKPLNKLYQVCETQGRIGTVSLHEHLDACGDLLAGMAIDIRRAIDKVKELNQ